MKEVANAMIALAAKQSQSTGSFKLAGALNVTVKTTLARPEKTCVSPITKKPWVVKAKPWSRTLRVSPTKKFKGMVKFARGTGDD